MLFDRIPRTVLRLLSIGVVLAPLSPAFARCLNDPSEIYRLETSPPFWMIRCYAAADRLLGPDEHARYRELARTGRCMDALAVLWPAFRHANPDLPRPTEGFYGKSDWQGYIVDRNYAEVVLQDPSRAAGGRGRDRPPRPAANALPRPRADGQGTHE